jgi:hypothetical protein
MSGFAVITWSSARANSLVELYFNVGLLGIAAWLFFIGSVYQRLYRLLRAQAALDYELVSVAGVMIFLLMKALAATVFVYLDASMLILAGAVIYVVRRLTPAGGTVCQTAGMSPFVMKRRYRPPGSKKAQ